MTNKEEPAIERARERSSKQKEQHIQRPQGKAKPGGEEKQGLWLLRRESRSKVVPRGLRKGGKQPLTRLRCSNQVGPTQPRTSGPESQAALGVRV